MAKLSIIVPVFNEAPELRRVVKSLMESPCPVEREWIFVDDASTDGSLSILRELSAEYGFQVVAQPTNRGKGRAVKTGIDLATGSLIMIQDADYEYDPCDVPALLEPILANKADVVYGSRFKRTSNQVHRTLHYSVNRFLTFASNYLSGIYLTDMETCYKIFRAPIIKSMKLKSRRFGIEVELTAYVAKLRVRIHEIPISYFPRQKLQGKKINWRDGVAAMVHLVRFNLFTSLEQAFDRPEQFMETLQQSYDLPQFNYLKGLKE